MGGVAGGGRSRVTVGDSPPRTVDARARRGGKPRGQFGWECGPPQGRGALKLLGERGALKLRPVSPCVSLSRKITESDHVGVLRSPPLQPLGNLGVVLLRAAAALLLLLLLRSARTCTLGGRGVGGEHRHLSTSLESLNPFEACPFAQISDLGSSEFAPDDVRRADIQGASPSTV